LWQVASAQPECATTARIVSKVAGTVGPPPPVPAEVELELEVAVVPPPAPSPPEPSPPVPFEVDPPVVVPPVSELPVLSSSEQAATDDRVATIAAAAKCEIRSFMAHD
jgi:hypothetical protein